MTSVIDAAETTKVRMPWARGLRRQAMISRRAAAEKSSAPRKALRA